MWGYIAAGIVLLIIFFPSWWETSPRLIAGAASLAALFWGIQLKGDRLRRMQENNPIAFRKWVVNAVPRSQRMGRSIPSQAAGYFCTEATREWALAAGFAENSQEIEVLESMSRIEERLEKYAPLMRYQIILPEALVGFCTVQLDAQGEISRPDLHRVARDLNALPLDDSGRAPAAEILKTRSLTAEDEQD